MKRRQTDGEWMRYRDRLVTALRELDVPGNRIGEVLAEVEAHLAESGERPHAAFGDPEQYAREIAVGATASMPHTTASLLRSFIIPIALCAVGGLFLMVGAFAFAANDDAVADVPTWAMLVASVVLLVIGFAMTPPDIIRDPRNSAGLYGGHPWLISTLWFFGPIVVVLVVAWLVASVS